MFYSYDYYYFGISGVKYGKIFWLLNILYYGGNFYNYIIVRVWFFVY